MLETDGADSSLGPTGLMLGDALTEDTAEAADLYHPRGYRLEKSVKLRPLRKLMVKFEVTGDERLTRTFLQGLTDGEPTESSTSVVCE